MNLDNLINRKLNKTIYKQIKPRRVYKQSKESIVKSRINRVIRLIKTGDFNPQQRSDNLDLSLAIKNGYVEKGTLTILKED